MKGQRTAYSIHSWTGLITGWLLFAICLTGTLVVYKFPLKALSNPEIARVHREDRLGPDGALAAFRQAVPDALPRVVAFPSDAYSIHQYSVVAEGSDGKEKRYWVDAERGTVRPELQSDFADFIQRLHAGLFMGQKGRWIVGALGLTMAVSILAGLWFHWPHLHRDLFHLRLGAHRRKAWADLHKAGGVWALPFHIVIALTGAWLGLEGLIGIRASDSSPIEIAGEGPGNPLPIAEILRRAKEIRPDLTPSHVNITNLGVAGSTIRVQGDLPGHRLVQRGQTMLVFDAYTGRLLQTIDRTRQGTGRHVLAMMRPLHYGYFAPPVSEIAYFVLGALSTVLVASGMFIWAERDRRRRHPRDPEAVTGMERANAAIMGGLMAALSLLAMLHSFARLWEPASFGMVGGFRFLASQDLLSGRSIAPELWLFLAMWAGLGLLLCQMNPLRAWRMTLAFNTAALIGLVALTLVPIRGTQLLSSPLSDGAGYAAACLAMAGAFFLSFRRLRDPAPQNPKQKNNV